MEKVNFRFRTRYQHHRLSNAADTARKINAAFGEDSRTIYAFNRLRSGNFCPQEAVQNSFIDLKSPDSQSSVAKA